MTSLLLLLSLRVLQGSAADTLHAVDLYGLRTTPAAAVREAIGVNAGDALPTSLDAMRARLQRLPGVEEVDLSPVCCSETGRTMLYVGIRERGTAPIVFRPAPSGAARLPEEIADAGRRFDSALLRAVQRGVAGEDHTSGHALAEDSALRAVQHEFVRFAAAHIDTLTAIVRYSANAAHRALAAQVIAYAPDKQHVARELLAAVSDLSDDVRNNAVRALAVLADWANEHPEVGLVIPAAPFTALLNSLSWTDRNKGVMVLIPLTATRDPSVLAAVRTSALPSLVEMARWSNPGHAVGPFLLIARLAGIDDGDAFQAFQSGEREAIIARVLAASH